MGESSAYKIDDVSDDSKKYKTIKKRIIQRQTTELVIGFSSLMGSGTSPIIAKLEGNF